MQVVESMQNQSKLLDDIMTNCRRSIAAEHGVMLSCVVLLRTRTIPKTTSGKIARSWCRRGYVDGTLGVLSRWDADSSADGGEGVGETEGDGSIALYGDSPQKEGGATRNNRSTSHAGAKYISAEPGADDEGEDSHSRPAITEVRALSLDDIAVRLETTLKQISAQSPAPITGRVDKTASLSSLGLDSCTIVQFKGVLEKR